MLRAIRYATLMLGSMLLGAAYSQPVASISTPFGLEAGQYSVGFRLLEGRDDSRMVNGGTSSMHARPIRTYLWYPAERADGAKAMRFGQYAALADDDIWPANIAGNLRERLKFTRRPLVQSLGTSAFATLSARPVFAVENAKPLDGPYPLIVIGQGIYYESPIAFAAFAEYLAGRGFVVATCPLVGTNSPLVRVDRQDLETQVRDLEFVIAQARRSPFVSPEKLGVFGFDMGGMAGVILAMRDNDVDAFASVDSGILYAHPSGLPASAPDYDPLSLRIAWLHGTGKWATASPDPDDVSLFDRALHSNRYLLVAEGMAHVDFTSYALVENRGPMLAYWEAATSGGAEAHKIVAEYVYNFFDAYLNQSERGLAFLSRTPADAFPGSPMTLEHRAATPPSLTYDQFVQDVVAGRAEEAIAQLRSIAEVEPAHMLLDETYLRRLAISLLRTWGLGEEAIPVIEFWAERYPASIDAQQMLAEGHILIGDYPAAIDIYSRLLEQNPDNSRSRSRLEWLRSR